MANLKTDYKDDILDSTQNIRRKFRMITNDDGTFSFEDVTDYLQYGDSFGALDLNAITNAIMNECLKRTDVVDNTESTATDLPLSANMGRELKVKTKYVKSQLTTSVYGYYYFDETTKIYTGTTKIPIPEDAIEILGVLPGSCYSLTSDSIHHYPFECVYYNGEISCAAYSPTSQTLEFGVTIIYR